MTLYKARLARTGPLRRAGKNKFLSAVLIVTTALLVGLLGEPVAQAAGEFRVKGVVLPNGAVRIGDDRYRLPESWDATLKFYRGVYRPEKFPRRFIVNQPGIKAWHFVNPDSTGEWEGFNLYESQGEVRLYILGREAK